MNEVVLLQCNNVMYRCDEDSMQITKNIKLHKNRPSAIQLTPYVQGLDYSNWYMKMSEFATISIFCNDTCILQRKENFCNYNNEVSSGDVIIMDYPKIITLSELQTTANIKLTMHIECPVLEYWSMRNIDIGVMVEEF